MIFTKYGVFESPHSVLATFGNIQTNKKIERTTHIYETHLALVAPVDGVVRGHLVRDVDTGKAHGMNPADTGNGKL